MNISLLPAEAKKYRIMSRKMNTYSVAAAFLILAFVLVYAFLSVTAIQPQQRLNSIVRQRQKMQKEMMQLKPYEDMCNMSEAAKKLLTEAMGTNPQWDVLFVKIFNSIPEETWLSGFTSTYGNDSGKLTIKGCAGSNSEIAEWLPRLKAIKGLSNVQCQFAVKTWSSGGSNIQFEISAVLTRGKTFEMPAEGRLK